MARVTLPSGCTGLDMADGTKYTADRQGSSIDIDGGHARAVRRGYYGDADIMTGTRYSFGTKTGRRCEPCSRTWNTWSLTCPRCHRATRLAA
jgi:hypothetical protein